MKKVMIPLTIVTYLLMFCYTIIFIISESSYSGIFSYTGFFLVIAIINLEIANLIIAILNVRKVIEPTFKETMIFKLVLIPYHIFNIILSILVLTVGFLAIFTLFIPASLPLIIFSFLILCFGYIFMVCTSMHNVMQLIIRRKELPIVMFIIHMILQFVPIADVVSSALLYVYFKDKKSQEKPENDNDPIDITI